MPSFKPTEEEEEMEPGPGQWERWKWPLAGPLYCAKFLFAVSTSGVPHKLLVLLMPWEKLTSTSKYITRLLTKTLKCSQTFCCQKQLLIWRLSLLPMGFFAFPLAESAFKNTLRLERWLRISLPQILWRYIVCLLLFFFQLLDDLCPFHSMV
jgi:hypothetical protein